MIARRCVVFHGVPSSEEDMLYPLLDVIGTCFAVVVQIAVRSVSDEYVDDQGDILRMAERWRGGCFRI